VSHHHPCQVPGCEWPVDCDGELARNPDGAPETVCRTFHLPNGAVNEDWQCEACRHIAATAIHQERAMCPCGSGWTFDFLSGRVYCPTCDQHAGATFLVGSEP
jgi:hypothetical protein